jgi:predicted ATPase
MIEKIEIRNFKSIKELDLLLQPMNILIGANGVGKSNFIFFFKLLKEIYEQNLRSYVSQQGGADNLLYFGRKNSEMLGGLVLYKDMVAYYFNLKPDQYNNLYFDIEGDYFCAIMDCDKDYQNGKSWMNRIWGRGHKESMIKDNVKEIRAQIIEGFFTSFRTYHFHDTSDTAKIKQISNVNDNRFLREDGSNLAPFLYLLSEKHSTNFRRIEGVIRSIAPFFDRFDLAPDRHNSDNIMLEWKERGSDMYFNAHHLSDGTLRMIALTTLLLQPNPPETIIIDEPELGLHPMAINKLAAMLKQASRKSQIILSTQSVNLLDNFEPEDIIAVDRKGKQSVFQRLDKNSLESWLSEYTLGELWNKNVIGARP